MGMVPPDESIQPVSGSGHSWADTSSQFETSKANLNKSQPDQATAGLVASLQTVLEESLRAADSGELGQIPLNQLVSTIDFLT